MKFTRVENNHVYSTSHRENKETSILLKDKSEKLVPPERFKTLQATVRNDQRMTILKKSKIHQILLKEFCLKKKKTFPRFEIYKKRGNTFPIL